MGPILPTTLPPPAWRKGWILMADEKDTSKPADTPQSTTALNIPAPAPAKVEPLKPEDHQVLQTLYRCLGEDEVKGGAREMKTGREAAINAVALKTAWQAARSINQAERGRDAPGKSKGGRPRKWEDAERLIEELDEKALDDNVIAARLHQTFSQRPDYQTIDASKVREIRDNAKRRKQRQGERDS